MIHVFEGETANQVWQQAFQALSDDNAGQQAGRGGATRELLHTVFSITDPRQRWVVGRQPPINPAFALAEVIWLLNGHHEAAFLNYWNRHLPDFAGHGDTYPGAYGFRLRQHFGLDQLACAYQTLHHNPDGRQVVLQLWDATADFPRADGGPASTDVPCNVLALLKVRNGKLEWTQINRSNDLFRGVPYNFIQFTTLQEILAGWLGIELGAYTHYSDSLHLYDRDRATVGFDPGIPAFPNTDTLAFSYDESQAILPELYRRAELLTHPNLSIDQLATSADASALPSAFHHWLVVLIREASRRRGWSTAALSDDLANPVLQQLWERWQQDRRS